MRCPSFFTSEEFDDSLDVFPIEFRLMKRAYRVLYGRDLPAGREASKEHLRWQTEYELRGKLCVCARCPCPRANRRST